MTSEHGWWFYLDISPQYCEGSFADDQLVKDTANMCRLCHFFKDNHDSYEESDKLAYQAAYAASIKERKKAKQQQRLNAAREKNMDFRPKFSQANQDDAINAVLRDKTGRTWRSYLFID